jgi:tartrate dehydratase beta subunit/fumarate hydratase class I family protein
MRDETRVLRRHRRRGALLASASSQRRHRLADLGAEAVARLEVVDFPAIVVNDCTADL